VPLLLTVDSKMTRLMALACQCTLAETFMFDLQIEAHAYGITGHQEIVIVVRVIE
jgi:hypothetical protein